LEVEWNREIDQNKSKGSQRISQKSV